MNPEGQAASGRALVLLVDDCEDSREMYAEFLSSWFDVAEAGTGTEAVDKASTIRPDAIVMDMGLPDMRGEDAILQLRRDARTEKIPVVVVSGFAEPRHTDRLWDAYLTKPCRPDLLADCIGKILSNR